MEVIKGILIGVIITGILFYDLDQSDYHLCKYFTTGIILCLIFKPNYYNFSDTQDKPYNLYNFENYSKLIIFDFVIGFYSYTITGKNYTGETYGGVEYFRVACLLLMESIDFHRQLNFHKEASLTYNYKQEESNDKKLLMIKIIGFFWMIFGVLIGFGLNWFVDKTLIDHHVNALCAGAILFRYVVEVLFIEFYGFHKYRNQKFVGIAFGYATINFVYLIIYWSL